MTTPVSPDALDALRKSLAMAANDPGNVTQADGTKVGYKGDRCMGGWIADALIAGPLAPLLAALQQVTVERDEARAENDRFRAGLANGSSPCAYCNLSREDWTKCRSGFPGCDRADDAMLCPHFGAEMEANDRADAATSELARLRAEGEAKDRALKAKAEEQVAYWRKRQEAEKCLEDGVSEDGSTYTPIGDEAAWQGGYCNGRMSEADWWLKTLLHWPSEAARAATAREGA